MFACDPLASAKVVALVREQLPRDIPIFAKLSPDVTDIVEVAKACVKAGADGLTMINTLLGMVIDTDLLRPQLAGITGGLSGPAVRPVAVRAIWQTRAAMLEGRLPTVPIIGVGGVRTGADALQMVAAGASAVQVGTATFNDPSAPVRVNRELAGLLHDRGFARLGDAVGVAHTASGPAPMSTTTATYGARLHRAMGEHGPLCVGIDPHPGLLAAWGLPETVQGLETLRDDLRRGLRRDGGRGQAAVGVLRAVRVGRGGGAGAHPGRVA